MTEESLSEKRARAGRLGAAKRWGGRAPEGMRRDHLRMARPTAQLVQGRTDWYRIENKAKAEAEVYIYDEIGYFGITASDFVRDLQDVTAERINLHLNTPGGEVFDGIAIYNALRNHEAEVTTYVDGLAASAGSFIAMAGDSRVIAKNGTLMIHDGQGLCIGNAEDMRDLAALLDKCSDNIASIYADNAGGSVSDWRELMKAETWFNADEAVDHGLMHEIYGESEAENTWDLSIFNYRSREEAPAPPKAEDQQVKDQSVTEIRFDPDMFRRAMEGVRTHA